MKTYDTDKATSADKAAMARFAACNEVGDLACTLHLVGYSWFGNEIGLEYYYNDMIKDKEIPLLSVRRKSEDEVVMKMKELLKKCRSQSIKKNILEYNRPKLHTRGLSCTELTILK